MYFCFGKTTGIPLKYTLKYLYKHFKSNLFIIAPAENSKYKWVLIVGVLTSLSFDINFQQSKNKSRTAQNKYVDVKLKYPYRNNWLYFQSNVLMYIKNNLGTFTHSL